MKPCITTWERRLGGVDTTLELSYNPSSELLDAVLKDSTNATLRSQSWRYDKSGNRTTSITDQSARTYSHNALNQLVQTGGAGRTVVEGTIDKPAKITVNGIAAETDAENNYQAWIDVQPGSNTITVEAEDWTPNANTATQSWTVDVAGTPNRSFDYDDNGNTLSDGLRSYQWDAENRLTKITYADGSTTEFTYNGFSQRVHMIEKDASNSVTSDKRYLWAGGNQPSEQRASDGTTVLKRYYHEGEQRIGGSDAGLYYYTRDHLGSIREVTGDSGTLHAHYDYCPYGVRSKLSGDLDCDFGYTGHYYHTASGLHLTLYRAFDSKIGRWLSPDPLGEDGGLNLYAYVFNDPINGWDPYGLEFWSWTGTAGQWAENAAQFSMGMADHFTFGLHGKAREAIYGDDYSDPCSGWYKGGGYTGAAIELAATGGSIAAARSAAGVSARQLAKDRRALRSALNLQTGASRNRQRLYAHHNNPLRGHPGGSSTMFPTAGMPSWIKNSRFNGSALTHSQHMAAHQRLRNAEAVARGMGLGNAPIGAARSATTAHRNSNCD